MPVGLVPVDKAPALPGIDRMIDRAMDFASVGNAGRLNALKDAVEFLFADPEAIVDARERLFPLIEIERQAVVQVDRAEGPDAGFRPRHAQQLRHLFRRRELVARGHHQVIQFDRHRRLRSGATRWLASGLRPLTCVQGSHAAGGGQAVLDWLRPVRPPPQTAAPHDLSSSLRRLCACLALTVATPLASAQSASSSTGNYPERPIRLLLGQAGGE